MRRIIFILLISVKLLNAQSAWVSQYSNVATNLYSVYFRDSLTGWVCGHNAFIKTTNGGDNWSPVSSMPPRIFVNLKFFNDDTAYVYSNSTGAIFRTNDAWNSWDTVSVSYSFPSVWFANKNTGWGNTYAVYKTTNGGYNWFFQYHQNYGSLKGISFIDDNTGYLGYTFQQPPYFNNSYVEKTTDGGYNWTNIANFTQSPVMNIIYFANKYAGLISGESTGYYTWLTCNGGLNWVSPVGNITANTIGVADSLHIWLPNSNGIHYSSNGGQSFVLHNYQFFTIRNVYFVSPLRGWMVGNNGCILRTTTGAEKVPYAPALISPVNGDSNILVNTQFSWNTAATATNYRLQIAEDNLFASVIFDSNGILQTSYRMPNDIMNYNTQYYWRVSASNNIGQGSWSVIRYFRTSKYPSAPLLLNPPNNTDSATLTPLMEWENLGTSISQYQLQIAGNSGYTDIKLDTSVTSLCSLTVPAGILEYNILYYWHVRASNSLGWGPYSSSWAFRTIVSGIVINGTDLPTEFKMFRNYPNPFNSITIIKFQIPNPGNTVIKVFGITGKEVAVLVNEYLQSGTYEVRFDAKDLPSGIYFYRMEAEKFTETKKLILLK